MMDKTASGWMNGFLGMLIFSGSLPATRVAVAAFDPVFLTVARAGIAGLLGLALLLVFRQKRPERGDLISLAVVACGVVIGFPLEGEKILFGASMSRRPTWKACGRLRRRALWSES